MSQSITIPSDGCPWPLDEIQDTWVVHNSHSLSLSDKVTIEQGEQLTDKHMQIAQKCNSL